MNTHDRMTNRKEVEKPKWQIELDDLLQAEIEAVAKDEEWLEKRHKQFNPDPGSFIFRGKTLN